MKTNYKDARCEIYRRAITIVRHHHAMNESVDLRDVLSYFSKIFWPENGHIAAFDHMADLFPEVYAQLPFPRNFGKDRLYSNDLSTQQCIYILDEAIRRSSDYLGEPIEVNIIN